MANEIQREERTIYVVAAIVLGPVVAIAALRGVAFDAGTTVCLLGVVLAVVGLAASRRS